MPYDLYLGTTHRAQQYFLSPFDYSMMADTAQDNQVALLLDAGGTKARQECGGGRICPGRLESN